METLSSFWSGASRLSGSPNLGLEGANLTLDAAAVAAGGWNRFVRLSPEDLSALGLRWDVVHQLRNAPGVVTRGRAVTRVCEDWPRRLSHDVPHAPAVVFTEGDVSLLRRPCVAIVGTRRCSPYGASVAHRLASACASAGLVVVSGMARGIDTFAHQGALAVKGGTVAVLGHGLDHTAPPSNERLRERIAAEGLLLTALPDPVPPAPHTFPERNRWIAALSLRVVVVEAPERSGALHTARALLDVGRSDDVWVVPGPLGDPGFRGGTGLLLDGAKPLIDIDSFVRDLVGDTAGGAHPDWLSAVFAGAPMAEAARVRGVATVEVLRDLGQLELQGRVVRLPGGRYVPAGAERRG